MGAASFLSIFWQSNYQAAVIFVLGSTLFENSFYKVVTITFSALVFTELLNIFTLVGRPNAWIFGANLISLLCYVISVVFFRDWLGMIAVDWDIFWKIMVITLVCWCPFEMFKLMNRCWCPSVSDKIMLIIKRKDRSSLRDHLDTQSDLLSPHDDEV